MTLLSNKSWLLRNYVAEDFLLDPFFAQHIGKVEAFEQVSEVV